MWDDMSCVVDEFGESKSRQDGEDDSDDDIFGRRRPALASLADNDNDNNNDDINEDEEEEDDYDNRTTKSNGKRGAGPSMYELRPGLGTENLLDKSKKSKLSHLSIGERLALEAETAASGGTSSSSSTNDNATDSTRRRRGGDDEAPVGRERRGIGEIMGYVLTLDHIHVFSYIFLFF
jgi:hypothetical protein